jgi:hypothetical protein
MRSKNIRHARAQRISALPIQDFGGHPGSVARFCGGEALSTTRPQLKVTKVARFYGTMRTVSERPRGGAHCGSAADGAIGQAIARIMPGKLR